MVCLTAQLRFPPLARGSRKNLCRDALLFEHRSPSQLACRLGDEIQPKSQTRSKLATNFLFVKRDETSFDSPLEKSTKSTGQKRIKTGFTRYFFLFFLGVLCDAISCLEFFLSCQQPSSSKKLGYTAWQHV